MIERDAHFVFWISARGSGKKKIKKRIIKIKNKRKFKKK
jgi:hypothetical protein